MKIRWMKQTLSFVLVLLMTVATGCTSGVAGENLMQEILPNDVSDEIKITEEGNAAVTDFSVAVSRVHGR